MNKTNSLFLLLLIETAVFAKPTQVVILDPAGNAHDVGRTLSSGNERGAALRFAYALRDALIGHYNIDVLISRTAGDEEILPLQIPSFANRVGADFFLRIHLYKEEQEKPKLFLYHLMFHPLIDGMPYNLAPLALVPLHQAHRFSIHRTKLFGDVMYKFLSRDNFQRHFDCYVVQGLPLMALVGITAPALLLEVGVSGDEQWKSLVEPVAQSMSFFI